MLRWKANILNGQGEGNSIFPLSGKKVLNTSSDLCACTCTSVVLVFFFFPELPFCSNSSQANSLLHNWCDFSIYAMDAPELVSLQTGM